MHCELFNNLIGPDDIGVIAPYRAQNKKLRGLETVKQHAERLKIGTVEAFQAQVNLLLMAICERLTLTYDVGATYHHHVHGEKLTGSNRF